MPSALRPSGSSVAATFEVERLDVADGRLIVEGHWSGVRGMRFLRPTLVVDGRQVLATLEHKPWAPEQEGLWTAAFPWAGDPGALVRAWLEVAPSVTVPLGPVDQGAPPASKTAGARTRSQAEAIPSVPEDDRQADTDRDRALAVRDEAIRDREAAVRMRDRMSRSHDDALAAVASAGLRCEATVEATARDRDDQVAAAGRERDEAIAAVERGREVLVAERDTARTERDVLRAQHDDVLLAHRALEEVLRSERAERAGASAGRSTLSATPRAPGRTDLATFDRWAPRVFGTAAATCFGLLLLLLVRLFV